MKKVLLATQRRPSVAIFGQSQVGKSYLVQNLTKPSNSPYLEIQVGIQKPPVNFLTEMNPAGGQESTGTVTRFTTIQEVVNNQYPIHVELFGVLDVAAIMINGYLSDLKELSKDDVLTAEESKALFLELASNNIGASHITSDEVSNFVEYVRDSFSDAIVVHDLGKIGYFRDLVEFLPTIQPDKIWLVLEVLWNKNSFISELFQKLVNTISTIGHDNHVSVTFDAVSPNTSTILDVERVKELFGSNSNHGPVKLITSQGLEASLPRATFSALTKEVQLSIANDFANDSERQFLQYSDLLDFPGSKSREKIPESVFNGNSSEQKLQLFIRGKVSYLFDTYSNNQGVSSLLYCMDDNPPEEKEAPARLHKWISKYVGKDPDHRLRRANAISDILKAEGIDAKNVSPLMVVMTKFNQEMNKVLPGQESDREAHDAKWAARLDANFSFFMDMPVEDKWTKNWTSTKEPFKYVFPVRDPLYSQATFDGMNSVKEETGVREDRRTAIDSMGSSFKSSEVVKRHIINPDKVWKEISSPNGTGIDYLCHYLAPASHPAVTYTRLSSEIVKLKSDLLNVLEPFLLSGNIQHDLNTAQKQASLSWTGIMGVTLKSDMVLSRILNGMIVSDTEIWNLLYEYKFKHEDALLEPLEENISADSIIQLFNGFGIALHLGMTKDNILELLRPNYEGFDDTEIQDTVKNQLGLSLDKVERLLNKRESDTASSDFTSKVITYWHQKLLSVTMEDSLFDGISDNQRDAVTSVVNEIVKAKGKFSLANRMGVLFDTIVTGTIERKDFDLVASCCANILNNFFFTAGWAYAPDNDKPPLPIGEGVIFSSLGRLNTETDLS
ncbi:putative virulence factor, partial [Flavobacteriales bacterium]|nr:putative virulence factor [Flavobacteriales bacterium]